MCIIGQIFALDFVIDKTQFYFSPHGGYITYVMYYYRETIKIKLLYLIQ